MEFCDGGQIDDIEYLTKNKMNKHRVKIFIRNVFNNTKLFKICRMLGKLYSEMIFVNGFVHCDPHPGNILVRINKKTKQEEIVLLDHGLYSVNLFIFYINIFD